MSQCRVPVLSFRPNMVPQLATQKLYYCIGGCGHLINVPPIYVQHAQNMLGM